MAEIDTADLKWNAAAGATWVLRVKLRSAADEIDDLRARLAEVEAERDRLFADTQANSAEFTRLARRLNEQGHRLAAVEALCDDERNYGYTVSIDEVRAAARGEGDRA